MAARMGNLELPQDASVLAGVGKVAIRHGQLDDALKMTVKTLTGVTPREARDATERDNSSYLTEQVRKLARQKLGEGQALVRLRALLGRCQRATRKRNDLLHSLWVRELDGEDLIMSSGGKKAPPPTPEELEQLAEELLALALELHEARLRGFLKEALDAAANAS